MNYLPIFFIVQFGLYFPHPAATNPTRHIAKDSIPVICGTFVAKGSGSIVDTLHLSYWNTAVYTTPADGMLRKFAPDTSTSATLHPTSHYFIAGDTLFLEMDKGYFLYRITEEDLLLGMGNWNKNDTLVRIPGKSLSCPSTHTPSESERTWLVQSRSYYEAYYSTDYDKALSSFETLCEASFGPACMTLGLATLVKDEEQGIQLLEKACEIGYFGNYACYRLGETLSGLERYKAARTAYQQACEGGHIVGCMAIYMMDNLDD